MFGLPIFPMTTVWDPSKGALDTQSSLYGGKRREGTRKDWESGWNRGITQVCGIFNTSQVYGDVWNHGVRAGARQWVCLRVQRTTTTTTTTEQLVEMSRGGQNSSNKISQVDFRDLSHPRSIKQWDSYSINCLRMEIICRVWRPW